ncbi:MAG TPA: ABC transporter permease [Negativicutes bacterium]|jgi:NitT/TauT family transport system permease protein
MSVVVKSGKQIADDGKGPVNKSQRTSKPGTTLAKQSVKVLQLGGELLQKILGISVFLLLWEIAPRAGLVDSIFIPPFSEVAISFYKLMLSGKLPYHIGVSLQRSLAGLGLGILISIPLGLLIGRIRIIENFLDPVLQTFRQTSSLALLPVFMLLFGIGEVSKILIIFWGVQWPILLNTISGVKNVDPLFIKSAKSMGASQFEIFEKVILPAASPSIFTGIRLAGTAAILLLVASEMVGASAGLGFLVFDFEVKYAIPEMFATIVTFALLGLALNYILVRIERNATKWKESDTPN